MSVIIRKNRIEDNNILTKIIRTSFHDFEIQGILALIFVCLKN